MLPRQMSQQAMETRLRQGAPALRLPDSARIDRVCAQLASRQPPPSPLKAPRTFFRPLLRVAACLLLMLGIAVLMRPKPRPSAAPQPPPAFVTFRDLTNLVVPQEIKNTLACEAEDLATDIASLTAVLNERSLAILF